MTAPIELLSKDQLLDKFQSKVRCMHTQDQAEVYWLRLQRHLTEGQKTALFQGWDHHVTCREGCRELDEACNSVRLKWNGVESTA